MLQNLEKGTLRLQPSRHESLLWPFEVLPWRIINSTSNSHPGASSDVYKCGQPQLCRDLTFKFQCLRVTGTKICSSSSFPHPTLRSSGTVMPRPGSPWIGNFVGRIFDKEKHPLFACQVGRHLAKQVRPLWKSLLLAANTALTKTHGCLKPTGNFLGGFKRRATQYSEKQQAP